MRKICRYLMAGGLLALALSATGCDMSLKEEKEQRLEGKIEGSKIVTDDNVYQKISGYSVLFDNRKNFERKCLVDAEVPLLLQGGNGKQFFRSLDGRLMYSDDSHTVYMTADKIEEVKKGSFETFFCDSGSEYVTEEYDGLYNKWSTSYPVTTYKELNDLKEEMILSDLAKEKGVRMTEEESYWLSYCITLYKTDKDGLLYDAEYIINEDRDHNYYFCNVYYGGEQEEVVSYDELTGESVVYPVSPEIVKMLKPYMNRD